MAEVAGTVTATAPLVAEGAATVAAATPAVEGSTVIAAAIIPEGTTTATGGAEAITEVGESVKELEQSFEAVVEEKADPEAVMHQFADEILTSNIVTEGSDSTIVTGKAAEDGGKEPIATADVNEKGAVDEQKVDGDGEAKVVETDNPLNSETETNQKITERMIGWDEAHEVPTEEKEYLQYLKDRVAFERECTVNARVESELEAWRKESSSASDAEVAAKKEELTKKHNRKYDRELKEQMKKYKKEHDGEMSAAEFAQKVEELQQLQAAIAENGEAIRQMNLIPTAEKTKIDEVQLRGMENNQKRYIARAKSLQAELRAEAARPGGPAWKRMLLPMLLAFTVVTPALQNADKESAQ